MTRVGLFLVLILVAGLPLTSQEPRFEVASVKRSAPNDSSSSGGFGPGATVRFFNVTLRNIIAAAYDLPDSNSPLGRFKLVGGPSAILSRHFDIDARAPVTDADLRQKKAMLRTLLTQRFKLRIRSEVRQVPIYVLTMARNELGPKIKRSDMNCVTLRAEQMRENKVPKGSSQCWADESEYVRGARPFRSAGPISHLVDRMQDQFDRPLIDGTGLTGNFEWSTRFRSPSSDAGAPLFMDAIQQDFGLRVEGRTGPYEVFVIDSVDMPTPN